MNPECRDVLALQRFPNGQTTFDQFVKCLFCRFSAAPQGQGQKFRRAMRNKQSPHSKEGFVCRVTDPLEAEIQE